jgi:hypothetical protein
MPRIVHPFRSKVRCTRDIRVQRVCTRRAARCGGAHHDCPACQRVWLAKAIGPSRKPSKAREVRRIRAGASTPTATSPRLRRRKLSRRCH